MASLQRIDIDPITTLMSEGVRFWPAHRIIEKQAELNDLSRQMAGLRERTTNP